MPFPDDSFDGVWSIWVFEHVPNPEQAFREARRVTRDGGVLFLLPAWNCPPWAAQGYEVRPYSDFNWWGKSSRASIPLRSSSGYWFRLTLIRAVRKCCRDPAPRGCGIDAHPNYEMLDGGQ
jgi:SAM-dependent methyltransferase